MSREYDPETDPMPDGDGGGSGDVERPDFPVPPDEIPPAPIDEPPDAPNAPEGPNPEPVGDPSPGEPTRYV